MNGKKRGSVALWVLAALLLVVDLIGLAMGISSVQNAGRGASWHLTAGEITATALSSDEVYGADPSRSYYELVFQLTNNSTRDLPLSSYWLSVKPERGDKYAARLMYGDSSVQYAPDPVVPMGCTATVRLTLSVLRDEIQGDTVGLWFDEYGDNQRLGTVSLP